jgi:hypothetical protein
MIADLLGGTNVTPGVQRSAIAQPRKLRRQRNEDVDGHALRGQPAAFARSQP